MMQKFVTRNVRVETLGNVPYIHNNLPTNQGSPYKLQIAKCLHIYRKQWKTGSYTWAFIDIEEASDSTSHDITCCQMTWDWRNTIAMVRLLDEWQKNYSNTHRRNTGGICSQVLTIEGHFTSYLWSLVEENFIQGINGHRCNTLVCANPIYRKFPNTVSQLLQGSFTMENRGMVKLRYQSMHKRFSTPINILETRSLKTRSVSRTLNFFQNAEC